MLSEKPWKADALIRLGASVLICFFAGQLLILLVQYVHQSNARGQGVFFTACAGGFGFSFTALWLLTRRWRFEQMLLAAAALPMCLYFWFVFALWSAHLQNSEAQSSQTTARIVISVLSFQGAALVLIHRFIREHGMGWAEAFGLKNNWRRALLLGTTIAVFVIPLTWGILNLTDLLLRRLHVQPEEQVAVQIVREAQAPLDRIVLALATIVIAPLAEEMLFRGILYPAVKRAGFPQLAVWGTAAAFAGIHLDLVRFVPLMVLALALIWVYEMTDNLLACITTHSLFNGISFVMLSMPTPH